MIPLRMREGPWFSPAAWSVAAVDVAVFVWLLRLPPALAQKLVSAWAFSPASFLGHPWSGHELATLLTSSMLHASWLHLLGNMLYLVVFGPHVENRLGWRGFLALYVSCAAISALAQGLLAPSPAPVIGASGAIAGVLGASLVLEPRAKVTALVPFIFVFFVTIPSVVFIGIWFAMQATNAFGTVISGAGVSGIAWFAHVGGFVAGAMIAAPVAAAQSRRR